MCGGQGLTLAVFNHSPPHILIQDLCLELAGWLTELVSLLQESLFWDYRQEIKPSHRSPGFWGYKIWSSCFHSHTLSGGSSLFSFKSAWYLLIPPAWIDILQLNSVPGTSLVSGHILSWIWKTSYRFSQNLNCCGVIQVSMHHLSVPSSPSKSDQTCSVPGGIRRSLSLRSYGPRGTSCPASHHEESLVLFRGLQLLL